MKMVAAIGVVLFGLSVGAACAADMVRVELVGGQVLQGKLVGNSARELYLEIPGRGQPVVVVRADIRRFSVVAAERPAPQTSSQAPRLAAADRTGQLRLSGANSMGVALMPPLIVDYGKEAGLIGAQEEVATDPAMRTFLLQGAESSRRLRVQVHSQGSSNAFSDLVNGQADIGLSTRRANEAEARALQLGGATAVQRLENESVVGLSGVVVIVHRDNSIGAITIQTLRDMLSGAISRWPSGGTTGLPVTIYALDRRSGDFEVVQERVLGLGGRLSSQARLFSSHEDLADAVAADPGGIGVVGVAYTRNARALPLDLDCGVGGAPTAFNLKTEEYPLSRRMYAYATARAIPLARDLLGYMVSPRGQAVVAQSGFVNLDPLLASAEDSRAQIASLGRFLPDDLRLASQAQAAATRQLLGSARRLSVTFRFEAGRSDLDPRAEADLERLVEWTRRTNTPGTSLALIGHASPEGQLSANIELSRARAQAVGARLRQLGMAVATIEGVGPVNQVVCGRRTTESDMNRRVEVWVR